MTKRKRVNYGKIIHRENQRNKRKREQKIVSKSKNLSFQLFLKQKRWIFFLAPKHSTLVENANWLSSWTAIIIIMLKYAKTKAILSKCSNPIITKSKESRNKRNREISAERNMKLFGVSFAFITFYDAFFRSLVHSILLCKACKVKLLVNATSFYLAMYIQ